MPHKQAHATWPPAQSVDARLFELWALRDKASADMRTAGAAADVAAAKMPTWARPGGKYLDYVGAYFGEHVGWPALDPEDAKKSIFHSDLAKLKVRFSPAEVRAEYEKVRRGALFRKDKIAARRRRDDLLTAIAARQRQQAQEERKVGLPRLERASERRTDRFLKIEDDILALRPSTPHTIAACVLIDLHHECMVEEKLEHRQDGTLTAASRVLEGLRPYLSGPIAALVAELLDHPSKALGEMALWPDRDSRAVAA